MEKLKDLPCKANIKKKKKAYKFSGVGTKGLACFVFFMGYVLYTNHPIPGLIFMTGGIFVFLISLYDGTIKQVLLYDDKIIFERNFGIYSVKYDEIIRYGNIKIGAFSRLFVFDLKKEIVRRSRKEALKTSLIFRISNIPFTNKDFKNFLITLEQKGVKQWQLF